MSHGNFAGFILGWAYFLSAVSVPAIEAEAVITYAATYTPKYGINLVYIHTVILNPLGILFAGLLMLLFFFVNYFGVRTMGKINTGMTWWKLIIPIATILILLVVHFNVSNLFLSNGFVPYGWSEVFASISVSGIVFSFLGFRQALDYGGEAKTPQRSIPIATIGSVLIGIAVYTMLQFVFIGQVDWSSLGVAVGNWAGLSPTTLYAAPFATLASSAGIVLLTYVLYADAYISPSGTLNVYLGTSMRTLYGLGTMGYLHSLSIKISKKHRIPLIPLVATFLVGLVFFAPFPSWYKMVGFITSATVFTYIVGGPALMTFRKHAQELHRPFKLGFAYILAPASFVGASEIVYWSGWPTVGYLAVAIFIGLAVWAIMVYVFKAPGKFDRTSIIKGVWVPVYIIVLSLLDYFGSFGGLGILTFPLDLVVVAVVGVIFYIWATKSGYKTDEIEAMISNQTQYLPEEGF